ncbi:MAG: ATP-binding cassette domain-containing protein [Clostridia bacterium]|nr:ATP-binding cassette domain-containing protein [Clostridia bacterium]
MLKLENICFSVDSKVILDNINLEINTNETIVITGHNGSGKSTLVNVIMGIVKATSGKIIFNGQDITNMSIDERANLGLAFAFQQPVKFKGIKVRDLLEIAMGEKLKISSSCDYLSKVGLCARDYLDRELDSTLSGGELKRIEIALALARNGKLNIFDEPEAGIDIWSFKSLIKAFESAKNENSSLIIVSHQEKIMELADKVLILSNGKVEDFDKKDNLLHKITGVKQCAKLGGENE